jgi:hypothetical protein
VYEAVQKESQVAQRQACDKHGSGYHPLVAERSDRLKVVTQWFYGQLVNHGDVIE